MRAVAILCLLVACKYHPGDLTEPGTDGTSGDDAPGESTPASCVALGKTCAGRTLQTCNSDGTAFDSQTCPLSCDVDHCTIASNLEADVQQMCTATAPAFVVDGAATGIAIGGPDHALGCASGCSAPIVPTRVEKGAIDLMVYCMSGLTLPATKTLAAELGLDASIVLFVAGDVSIAGSIDVRGDTVGNSGGGTLAVGGAGGFQGGLGAGGNHGPGNAGSGTCGGGGGATSTDANFNVGGGGGGGGYRVVGAAGGVGTESNGTTHAAAGGAGAICASSPPDLVPLIGGSGGGSGGDGGCQLTNCGRAGGGGGGAIQISATGSIAIVSGGLIMAGGGGGGFLDNNPRGGGGGGGAGGAILLEAPAISLAGNTLDVRGGDGGDSVSLNGGGGATPFAAAGTGASGGGDQGAAGGGGGIGRIRLNAKTGAICAPAGSTANDPCTTGALKLAP